MMRRLILAGLGVSCLLFAEESPRQKVQISKTEHIDFQAGGMESMCTTSEKVIQVHG